MSVFYTAGRVSKSSRARFLPVFAAFLLLFGYVAVAHAAPLEPEPYYGAIARAFVSKVQKYHVSGRELDDEIATRALGIFLGLLDTDKTFFLSSDISTFDRMATTLDDRLRSGDLGPAYSIVALFKKRARERRDYVHEFLARGHDFSAPERYVWDRSDHDCAWPADRDACDELWRRKLSDQLIRRIVAAEVGQPDDEEADTSPSEQVADKYDQFLTVLNDSGAEWVLQQYLSSFARAFDPHTDYLSPSTTDDFEISMRLSLVGIGALLSSEDGVAKIVRVIPGGPADRDGRLRAGDRIIAIGQEGKDAVSVRHWPLSQVVRLVRGEKGTKVVLTIVRAPDVSFAEPIDITLTRDHVKLDEQKAKGVTRTVATIDGHEATLGVIDLPSFYVDMQAKIGGSRNYTSSARDVRTILEKMKADIVEGVLLDLRGNGGGGLAEAVELTGLFLQRGPVVQVKERGGAVVSRWDDDSEIVYRGPLVVVVDRMSASASEILAGALQDYGRAIVVGDAHTHGKGTVQSLLTVGRRKNRWGSLKVTTATFYRISGASTQCMGVESDVIIESIYATGDIGEKTLPYALPWSRIAPASMRRRGFTVSIKDFVLRNIWRRKDISYQRTIDIEPLVATLREKSMLRRKGDAGFAAAEAMLSRLAARYDKKEVVLNLDERLKTAREEAALRDLQKEESVVDGGASGSEDDEKKRDLVMEEALQILADMVLLQSGVTR